MPVSVQLPRFLDPSQESVFESAGERLLRTLASVFTSPDEATTLSDVAGMSGPLAIPLAKIPNQMSKNIIDQLLDILDQYGFGDVRRATNRFSKSFAHSTRETARQSLADAVASRPEATQAMRDQLYEILAEKYGQEQSTLPVFRGMGKPSELRDLMRAIADADLSGVPLTDIRSFTLDPRVASSFGTVNPITPERVTGPVIRLQAPIESLVSVGTHPGERELILDIGRLISSNPDELALEVLRQAK